MRFSCVEYTGQFIVISSFQTLCCLTSLLLLMKWSFSFDLFMLYPAEGKGRGIVSSIETEKSEMRNINQQHSIFDDVKEEIEKDNYSLPNHVNSQKTVTSKEESADSRQVSSSLENDPSADLEMTLSNSREIPKESHLEDTLIGRETPSRGNISSEEQADESSQLENMPSDTTLSAMEVTTPAMSYSSQNAWRKLEQDLEEFFSTLEIHNETAFHDVATAQLVAPPGSIRRDSTTGSAYDRLWRGSEPDQVPSPAQSRSQTVREHVDEHDIDDRKPPANSPNDDVA